VLVILYCFVAGRLNIMFAMFNNLEAWLAPTSNSDTIQTVSSATPALGDNRCSGDSCLPDNIVNTNIITVSVGFKKAQSISLDEPIRFVLEHKQVRLIDFTGLDKPIIGMQVRLVDLMNQLYARKLCLLFIVVVTIAMAV